MDRIIVVDQDEANISNIQDTFGAVYEIEVSLPRINTISELVDDYNPAVILVNLGPDIGSNLDIIKSLTSTYDIPVIAMCEALNSREHSEYERRSFCDAGAWDYIETPFFRQVFFEKLVYLASISKNVDFGSRCKDMGKPLIFLLEDDDDDIVSISKCLDDDIFKVTYRKSVLKAKTYLLDEKKATPDLICIDIFIGEEDSGYKFFDWILSQNKLKDIPIVYMSSEFCGDRQAECISRGAVDFIRKPYSIGVGLNERLKFHLKIQTSRVA